MEYNICSVSNKVRLPEFGRSSRALSNIDRQVQYFVGAVENIP